MYVLPTAMGPMSPKALSICGSGRSGPESIYSILVGPSAGLSNANTVDISWHCVDGWFSLLFPAPGIPNLADSGEFYFLTEHLYLGGSLSA